MKTETELRAALELLDRAYQHCCSRNKGIEALTMTLVGGAIAWALGDKSHRTYDEVNTLVEGFAELSKRGH
jgi:hypothetical protein